MKQKSKKSTVLTKRAASTATKSSSGPSVHPCFHCGFIFARKDDFTQHMERYHHHQSSKASNSNNSLADSRCPECGQDFRNINDEKAAKEHLLFHDLAKILVALRCSELRKKRPQPLIVRAPPFVADPPSISAASSSWKEECSTAEKRENGPENITQQSGQTSAPPKQKGRPRSKSFFTVPSADAVDATIASIVTPKSTTTTNSISALLAGTAQPQKKRRRISNGMSAFEMMMMSSRRPAFAASAASSATTSTFVSTAALQQPQPQPPLPNSTPTTPAKMMVAATTILAAAHASPMMDYHRAQQAMITAAMTPIISTPTTPSMAAAAIAFSSATIAQQMPGFTPAPTTPTTMAQPPKTSPTLQSACPNCGQNLGKPWHLMDHMIQRHDAQLLRLHRTLKKPDGPDGQTTAVPQTFNDRQCIFCQLTHADMQQCLLHVVRTHRSRLFECPNNGECTLTCELMCAIGPETMPKKFTISVKVKRKTTTE